MDEVLRAQARHCRVWRAGLAAAVLLLVVVASLWLVSGRPGAGDVPTGAVVGYIEPCEGAPVALYTSTGARVFSAAATVEALRGHEYLKSLGGGSYRFVFPVEVAARERVAQNQQFRFDRLSPGRYVIMAHYTGGNAMTWVDILVVARRTADVDLPNMCM